MREVVNRILDGNFTSENTALDFSCSRIDIVASVASDYEGSFQILSNPGLAMEGFINATDIRMECGSFQVNGNATEVSYIFHTRNCDPGEVIKGSILIVSNQGEYTIPFSVTVTAPVLESSYGPLESLKDFINLAQTNWSEAVALFYSKDFLCLLDPSDKTLISYYRALSAVRGNEHNMEEFLLAAGKKKCVMFVTKTASVEFSTSRIVGSDGILSQELEIIRDGWGHTSLRIECEGDFLFTEETQLRDEHFHGNVHTLDIFVDASKCRTGKYTGKVRLISPYQTLEIPVEVSAASVRKTRSLEKNRRAIRMQLTRDYLEMRLNRLPRQQWILKAGQLTEQLLSRNEKDIFALLYKAQLLLAQERMNEAGWTLDQVADLLQEIIDNTSENIHDYQLPYCYHAYLTTLVRTEEDYVRNVTDRLERQYKNNRDEWRLYWFLLYLPSSLTENSSARWNTMESLYNRGVTSPILYLEALQDLCANPSLARSFDGFTSQVIYFGAKWQVLPEGVLEQVLYLAGKTRENRPLLRKTLEYLYQEYPQNRILGEICSQLIKAGARDEVANDWYKLGIEAELRLTNLFEYYMQSVNLKKMVEIPKLALMYFSYQNNLDYEHMAYLYRYILRNRRTLVDIYNNIRPAMERFAFEQISKRRINRHLAAIYEEVLMPGMLNRQLSIGLADLLFSNWITVEEGSFEKAYVYLDGAKSPRAYDIHSGEGWVAIYGNDYTIALEDMYGNRYLQGVEYTLEKLMLPGRYLRRVADFVWDHTRLNLYLCDNGQDAMEVTSENVLRYLQLSESEELSEEDRNKRLLQVMEFYYKAKELKQVERLVRRLQSAKLPADLREKYFHLLVLSGFYKEAYAYITENGFAFADSRDLELLLEKLSDKREFSANEIWDYVSYYCLKNGKPGSPVVKYLVSNYKGTSKDLRDIWKLAKNLELPRRSLSERLLLQLLYSGGFVGEEMEIFFDYAKGEAGDLKLVRAFLARCTYDYFVREKLMPDDVFLMLHSMIRSGYELLKVSKLAYLKYYAENPDKLDDEKRLMVLEYLNEMMSERIHLGFFTDFLKPSAFPETNEGLRKRLLLCLEEMTNLTVIDYRTKPGSNAKIHYVCVQENGTSQDYTSEYMREVCYGVCFKEFVLFFGETLQYYITEENGEKQDLTCSDDLQMSDIRGQEDSLYTLINEMLVDRSLHDYDGLDKALDKYYNRLYFGSELFKLQ